MSDNKGSTTPNADHPARLHRKRRTMKACLGAGTLALLSMTASAGTWIVDDDGGPGVDFTDIAPAVAAAAPGDTLLILDGIYSTFELDKPLALVAQPGAKVQGGPSCRVRDLPAGGVISISGLAFGGLNWPIVENCAGTVVLDGLELLSSGLAISASSDVRLRACSVGRGLRVESGRAEVAECVLEGTDAPTAQGCPGGAGGQALRVEEPGRAHVYRSNVQGGAGGTPNDTFNCEGGPGGHAVFVHGGRLLVAGDPAHGIAGGLGGFGASSGATGAGIWLVLPAFARVSGASVVGTFAPPGTLEVPVPRDPTLYILGQVGAGDVLTFRVQTEPGANVELMLGRKPTVGPQSGSAEVLLVEPLRTFQLGTTPANGVAGLNFTVPASAPLGFTFFGQARVTLPGGETRYTNSAPLIVR
jgi:hypothetical protein